MEKHLQLKPSVLAERYKFRQRKQNEGENVAQYIVVLKKKSKSCEFGMWLEESIQYQFVCGISNEAIRQRLFAADTLDYPRLIIIYICRFHTHSRKAKSMKAAEIYNHTFHMYFMNSFKLTQLCAYNNNNK